MLRRGTAADAAAIAAVLTDAHAAQEWHPELHTAEEDRGFVETTLLPTHEVWVEEEAGTVVGFAALKDDVLGFLFVHPSEQGRGVGSALFAKMQEVRPHGFDLWTFQANAPARSFYERRGLAAVEFTDGATNEERLPDVRYAWRPAPPGSSAR